MLDIQKYDNKNILFLKRYFSKKEKKLSAKLIDSMEKQEVKTRVTNKKHLARMNKLDDFTSTGIVWIDNLELFLLDGTINEPSYENIKKLIEGDRTDLMSYTKLNTMQKIFDNYKRNMYVLEERIKKYNWLMKHMKAQERTLKKFIKVLYDFNFTKAGSMSKKEVDRFFESKFKELEFI